MKRIILITILFLIQPTASKAQEAISNLSIKKFINLAKENDPNFEKITHDRRRLAFFLDQNSPYSPMMLNNEITYGVDSGKDTETSIYSNSISKELADSGTNISITNSGSNRADRRERVTQVQIEQSLYKNIFGQSNRLKETALNAEKQIIDLQITESYEDYMGSIISAYLEFHKAYLDQNLAEEIYQDTLILRKNVLNKKLKQIATQTDLDRSDLQVLLREEDVISKKQNLMSKWEAVKQIIGDKEEVLIPQINMEEIANIRIEEPQITNLRLYKIANLQEKVSSKELTLSKYDNRPSVQLVTGYKIDDSKRFSSTTNSNEFLTGIKLEIPLGNRVGNANEKDASFKLMSARIDKKSLENELNANLQDLKKQLSQLKEKIKVSEKKVIIMKRILKDEEKKYQYGKIDLERLIEQRSDFSSYRFEHQSDLLNKNKIIIDLLSLTDQLLDLKI